MLAVTTVTQPPSDPEIRAALAAALDGTLPFEGWEQPVTEILTSLAAGIAARATELLWTADDADAGPQTDPALDRWWATARRALAVELAPALRAHATMPTNQPLAPALHLRRRLAEQSRTRLTHLYGPRLAADILAAEAGPDGFVRSRLPGDPAPTVDEVFPIR